MVSSAISLDEICYTADIRGILTVGSAYICTQAPLYEDYYLVDLDGRLTYFRKSLFEKPNVQTKPKKKRNASKQVKERPRVSVESGDGVKTKPASKRRRDTEDDGSDKRRANVSDVEVDPLPGFSTTSKVHRSVGRRKSPGGHSSGATSVSRRTSKNVGKPVPRSRGSKKTIDDEYPPGFN